MQDGGVNRRGFLASLAASAVPLFPDSSHALVIYRGEPWRPRQPTFRIRILPQLLCSSRRKRLHSSKRPARIIPADDLGPGAKDCGVTIFIDHQLAGAYGRAQSLDMQGPWAKGSKTQGFQGRLRPAEMYRAAIKAIENHVGTKNAGKRFADLPASAQDGILSELEAGKLELDGVDAASFFKILWQNTKEGMFADPIYGGNKDMAGWKMLGFPGARYDYRDWVDRHGQRYDLPPVSIRGRPGWNENG